MKLAHIVPSLEARYGGPSKSVHALASACAAVGHQVELLATSPGEAEARSEDSLKLRIFHRDWPPQLCPSAGLREALALSPAEIIHHHSLWLRTLHYAHHSARAHGTKLVISPRGMMSPWAWNHHRKRKQLARALVHPGAFEAAQGWHATSTEEADDIRRLGFRQPVCVAPNGVRAMSDEQLVAAKTFWAARCPALRNRPVALFYSRLHRKKRLRELLECWLASARGDWFLLLVGVPEEYAIAEVQGWISAAGAGERVAVFDGTDAPPPYAVASLFLLPSHSENFGLVIAEAMAAGVPALVTDTTPWAALNAEGCGWCVAWPDFGRALAAALAEKSDRLAERGRRAREWVLREFSWEKSAAELIGFYQQLPSRPT